MTTYTITINEQTMAGKGVLSILKSLKDIVFIKRSGINESLLDIKAGRVYDAKNAKDLISKCSK